MSIPSLRLCAGVIILAYAAAAALVFQIGRPDAETDALRSAPLSEMVGRRLAALRFGASAHGEAIPERVVAITPFTASAA